MRDLIKLFNSLNSVLSSKSYQTLIQIAEYSALSLGHLRPSYKYIHNLTTPFPPLNLSEAFLPRLRRSAHSSILIGRLITTKGLPSLNGLTESNQVKPKMAC